MVKKTIKIVILIVGVVIMIGLVMQGELLTAKRESVKEPARNILGQ